jgi:hypothetical protein
MSRTTRIPRQNGTDSISGRSVGQRVLLIFAAVSLLAANGAADSEPWQKLPLGEDRWLVVYREVLPWSPAEEPPVRGIRRQPKNQEEAATLKEVHLRFVIQDGDRQTTVDHRRDHFQEEVPFQSTRDYVPRELGYQILRAVRLSDEHTLIVYEVCATFNIQVVSLPGAEPLPEVVPVAYSDGDYGPRVHEVLIEGDWAAGTLVVTLNGTHMTRDRKQQVPVQVGRQRLLRDADGLYWSPGTAAPPERLPGPFDTPMRE